MDDQQSKHAHVMHTKLSGPAHIALWANAESGLMVGEKILLPDGRVAQVIGIHHSSAIPPSSVIEALERITSDLI